MLISGKVQGVWYRASAAEIARELNLTGFAKNLNDGSVEIVAVGEKTQLEQLRKWCEDGPSGAKVQDMRAEWSDTEEHFESFSIL